MKGIYYIKIDGKYYIGQDSNIHKLNRVKVHLNDLEKNQHYNKFFQEAFNKRKNNVEFKVICESENYTREELSDLEKYYIQKYNSYDNGYNRTLGGWGGSGMKFTPEQLQAKSDRVLGEKNPSCKITNEEFFQIVDCFKFGFSNEEIGEMWGFHPRYVSLIRHKKRYKRLWGQVKDYEPEVSVDIHKCKKLTKTQFFEVIDFLKDPELNMQNIADMYNVDRSTISRINSRKLYLSYWEEYDNIMKENV